MDRQLRARVSEEVISEVEKIAVEIERENPGAEANVSTITRYAIHDYLRRYNGRKSGTVFLEIPLGGLICNEDLNVIFNALTEIRDAVNRNQPELPGVEPAPTLNKAVNDAREFIAKKMADPKNTREAVQEKRKQLYAELATEPASSNE
jgi:hypothetical protein